jgi:hypothetical protein
MTNRAYVDIILKVKLNQPWPLNATLKEVRERSIEEAKDRVIKAIGADPNITIEDEPKVSITFIEVE